MRIAYVAGFFKHVLPELQKQFKKHLDSGAVVWIPPYGQTDELNVNRFKGDFLGAVSRGATEILVCLFFMRKKPYLLETVQGIVDEGKSRSPGLIVRVEQFKSARDFAGVISKIEAFAPDAGSRTLDDADVSPPDNLDALPGWVLGRHSERIVLHPRAVNSAKKSKYEDVALIYAAVDFLGIEYWNMRTSIPLNAEERRKACDAKLGALGLDLSTAIGDSRAGEQGDEYEVTYPLGTDQKRVLELHLAKGSDREERFCLRIYFFWDGTAKKVVIGWLPNHLDTRGT